MATDEATQIETVVGLLGGLAVIAVIAFSRTERWLPWAARALYIAVLGVLIEYTRTKRGGFSEGRAPRSSAPAFNWHPTLMVAAFVVCGTEAVLMIRASPVRALRSRSRQRAHAVVNSAVTVLAVAGAIVAFESHSGGEVHVVGSTAPLHQERGHFPTAHSWLGLVTLLLMLVQVVLGVNRFQKTAKAVVHPYHRFFGLLVYSSALLTTVLGVTNFVDVDTLQHTAGDRQLGVITVLIWGVGACVLGHFSLGGDGSDDDERAALINT
mmetsp:Transcript_31721/g.83083  ORF Transcript_31721/g.83083 Transcript_31721/m.83083 type:complete len:267 (+) Transcript_31721:257-1057(+)